MRYITLRFVTTKFDDFIDTITTKLSEAIRRYTKSWRTMGELWEKVWGNGIHGRYEKVGESARQFSPIKKPPTYIGGRNFLCKWFSGGLKLDSNLLQNWSPKNKMYNCT